jgi:uroporphyrinogen III methyltransferase/synthase
MSALSGRRIVVTRARHQAGRLASALETAGAVPLFFPTITIRPVDDTRAVDAAVHRLADYAWIVFTSANAVATFWDRMRATNIASLPRTVRVAAVGPATAAELAIRGAAPNAQPTTHSGAAIAGAIGNLRDARVLLPCGDLARNETSDALRQAGAVVDEVVVYCTEQETPDADALGQLRDGVDALTFTSPSIVRGFAALLGGDIGHVLVGRVVLATIGPTTSAAVRDLGWPEPLEATVATVDGMVAALERHFAAVPRTSSGPTAMAARRAPASRSGPGAPR